MERRQGRFFLAALAALALAACCGAAFSQEIPGEFLQRARTSVVDYGAIPNDGKDDSAAIIRCRLAAIATGTYHVHFPAGTWDIDANNVLHPAQLADGTMDSATSFGILFTGDAQNYAILKLHRDEGSERWLYDSSVKDGWNRVQFKDLWFTSDLPNAGLSNGWNAAYAAEVNGFKIGARLATGVDKGFIFENVRFTGLGTPLQATGEASTDTLNAYSCWWHNCGPIIFENDQCLLWTFYNPHFWSPVDTFWVKNTTGMGAQGKGGAGAIVVRDGDMIHEAFGAAITSIADNGSGLIRVTAANHGFQTSDYVVVSSASSATGANNRWQVTRIDDNTLDLQGSPWAANGTAGIVADDTPYYTLRIDDGAAFARTFAFHDCRWELRQTYKSRLLHKRGDSSFTFTNEVLFNGCDISVNHGGESGATGREYLTLGGYTYVRFQDCHVNERFGIGFYDCNSSSLPGGQYQPLVEFEACALGPTFVQNLATRITYDTGDTNPGGFGRVISNRCRSLTSTNLSDNLAFDFDYGPVRGGRGEPSRTRKRISLKNPNQEWPVIASGTPGGERTVTLPPGARVLGGGFSKPASGSTTSAVQYAIGSDDKSTIFALSPPYKASGVHKAHAGEATDGNLFPYEVGSSTETFRLWMVAPGVNHAGNTGGDAYLEYE